MTVITFHTITKKGAATAYFMSPQKAGKSPFISYYHRVWDSQNLFHVITKGEQSHFMLSQRVGQPELISCHHKGREVTFHAIKKGGTARTYFMSSQRTRSHISCYHKGWDSHNLFHVTTWGKTVTIYFTPSQRVG